MFISKQYLQKVRALNQKIKIFNRINKHRKKACKGS